VKDWNLIVTIYQQGFRRALHALQDVGPTDRSSYYNVLVMKVDDPLATLHSIERLTEERPALYDAIARVAPAMHTFEFQSAEDFREALKSALLDRLANLKGRSFHVRLHRRGSKLDLHRSEIERLLDEHILAATGEAGQPARISFADPDAVIVIDTIDDRAGIAIWTREDLARHRLLRPD
jgi:tRNA(Ser,Leu) C12 N-acetylase TAN1